MILNWTKIRKWNKEGTGRNQFYAQLYGYYRKDTGYDNLFWNFNYIGIYIEVEEKNILYVNPKSNIATFTLFYILNINEIL